MQETTTPENGWWPANATIVQGFFKDSQQIGQVVKQRAGWRAFSLKELNSSGTGAKPIDTCSAATMEDAKKQVEEYVK